MAKNKEDRLNRQKRHPDWRTRRLGGMTVAKFSQGTLLTLHSLAPFRNVFRYSVAPVSSTGFPWFIHSR